MSWRYKLNACDTRLMRETWHHRVLLPAACLVDYHLPWASYETRNGKRNETQKRNGMGNEMTILYLTWNFFCNHVSVCLPVRSEHRVRRSFVLRQ